VSTARTRRIVQLSYTAVLILLTLVLLISHTDLAQLWADGWLFLLLLVINTICTELAIPLSPEVITDLSGLFSGAAVLSLGYNGVWIALLSNLYWLLKRDLQRSRRQQQTSTSTVQRLANYSLNLSLTTLPLWLGLFVYHELLHGEIPLTSLRTNIGPSLAFVLVAWLMLPVSSFPIVVTAERGVQGALRWWRDILRGLALTILVPLLFSPVLAIILNRLGVDVFVFATVGLLGISLMAQRLARSLASERQRVEELTVLNALGTDIIHNPPSAEATGALLAKHAPRFVPDADFQLCLFAGQESEGRQIVIDWRDGAARSTANAPLTPPWGWLRTQRQPLHAADLSQASLPFAWNEELDGPLPGSLLLVPLLASDPASAGGERCIGGILMRHTRHGAFTPEILPSIIALANQLAAALENARLHQEALARERLERELALARGIQTSFLPAGVPEVEGWTFVASLEPARYVSGDFYDFVPLPGGRWGVLIADVADKGMPAALYMALARTLIRAHAPDHADDAAGCLLAANDQILADTQSGLFVTVFYGILDPASGEMTFANAGHNPPYLIHRDSRPAEPLRNTGMALGVMPSIPLEVARTQLEPGDYLVLYTDGVTEAQDHDLNGFGSDRLLAAITSAGRGSADAIHHRVRSAVAAFVGDAPQFDDLTLMVVRREFS
jgi:serine phosphatase RsbU (regulator of sigma subunit)